MDNRGRETEYGESLKQEISKTGISMTANLYWLPEKKSWNPYGPELHRAANSQ